MTQLNKVIALILVLVAPFIQNCATDVEETDSVFKWVKEGNRLTYDLEMAETRISDYRFMDIIEEPGVGNNLIFQENLPELLNDPFERQLLLSIFSDVYRVKDGLHTTTCFSCTANPCLSDKDYLKVPLRPTKYQSIPEFLCGDEILSYDTVICIDSLVSVPLGEFQTIVINDVYNQSIKFWNEEAGLIRVDNYNELFSDTVKLVLSKKNY